MTVFAYIIALFFLFYLLGKSADVVVKRVRLISERLGIRLFLLGIILGLFTSLPEISIGINSLVDDVPDLSLGNLMGGFIVLFGLIMGVSLILNKRIKTDGNLWHYAPILIYFFLPFLFVLDGHIQRQESLVLIAAYVGLLIHLYRAYHKEVSTEKRDVEFRLPQIFNDMLIILVGLIAVTLISNVIVRITEGLLVEAHVSQFFIGVLLFSVGTNLPEIIVAFRAWQKHMKELTLAHLSGSAMTDPLLIGIFSFIQPYTIEVNGSYMLFFFFNFVLFVLVGIFYKTGKVLSRTEGIVLLGIYLLFLYVEITFGLKF
ncbi:sodium:calcium antiporter [Candidatus Uhrbacteria bacterium]|nr:sodium:calcium antiporter [Candidatus Uhrbacteria bacterium]